MRSAALTLLALLLAPALAAGQDAPDQGTTFKAAVNTRVAEARKVASEMGVAVVEIESGATVYSFNPETPRVTASNTKLVTSATALDRLGPAYAFETDVLVRGRIEGGTLVGDLAIVGGGDPTLSGRFYFGDPYGPFREWIAALKGLGVTRLEGTVYLVHGFFDDQRVHPDWPRDQLSRWYEAPVEALSFMDNCVLVKVKPNGGAGRPAVVEVVPEVDFFTVESTALTVAKGQREWMTVDRKSGELSHVLLASGRISPRTESYDKWVAVADPLALFAAGFDAALTEEGVVHAGTSRPVERLAVDEGSPWRRLITHRTDLLSVLEVVNKRSQNLFAESVLKTLGAELCGAGSWPAGVRVAAEFLAEIGVPPGSYSLADGSGMSRHNRFAPRHLAALLAHMFRHRWGAEFVRTLPYSGEEDLRWDERLTEPPYLGNVMAKTGYLNGVSTLSGYAKALSGKVYAFSILMNRIRSKSSAEAAQDKVVRAIVDHG